MFLSQCPNCGNQSVSFFHKLAAVMDTLVPAQCAHCAKFAIVESDSVSWLGFPELVFFPIAALGWLITGQLSVGAQVGISFWGIAFLTATWRAPLRPFVPDGLANLDSKRTILVISLSGGIACLYALSPLLG